MKKFIDDYLKTTLISAVVICFFLIGLGENFQNYLINNHVVAICGFVFFNVIIASWLYYDLVKHHSWATYPLLRLYLVASVFLFSTQRSYSFYVVFILVCLVQVFEYLTLKVNQDIRYIYANFPNQKFKTTIPKDYFVLSALQIAAICIISIVLFISQNVINLNFLAILIATVLFGLHGYILMKNYYANKENDWAFDDFDRMILEYSPDYLLFISYPENGIIHYSTWHETFEKFNQLYNKKTVFVTSFDYNYFEMIKEYPNLPIFYAPYTDRANRIAIDSVKAVIYVNPDQANMKFTRMMQLNHLMINHGDSDKSASAHKNYRMFDKNFVAGQAAVDRFKNNGIITQNNFFEIVGRPQLSDIEIFDSSNVNKDQVTIMYAPTWYGIGDDAHYSSQDRAEQIIDALLEKNFRVIYRSHPLSRVDNAMGVGINWAEDIKKIQNKLKEHSKKTGIKHIYGKEAEEKMSIYQCFNESDALISDISSVVSDYIYSEKPFAIVSNLDDTDQFISKNQVAKAAYVVDYTIKNISDILINLTENDIKKQERQDIKKYYLGDFALGKTGDEYQKIFFETLSKYL